MLSELLSQESSIPSCSNQHSPLLNLRLTSELNHVVLLKGTSEPRVGKDSQLFSRSHKRRIQMPLAPFLGIYPPVLARTLNLDVS